MPLHILLATDGKLDPDVVVQTFHQMALPLDTAITVLMVAQPLRPAYAHKHPLIGGMVRQLMAEVQASQTAAAKQQVSEFVMKLRSEGWQGRGSVRLGDPAEQIIQCACEFQPDLLVMGAGKLRWFDVLLGRETLHRVVSRVPCAVLVLKATSRSVAHQRDETGWGTLHARSWGTF